MTKKRDAKRSLLMSGLALVLCLVMLGGSSLAWYSDSVSAGNNKIETGKMNATMEWADGTKAVPAAESNDWTDASTGAIFDSNVKWEPGHVAAKHIKVENEGTLDFKFRVNIIPNVAPAVGALNLADFIDVYIAEEAMVVDPETFADDVAAAAAVAAVDPSATSAMRRVGTLTALMADPDGAAYGALDIGEYKTVTIVLMMQKNAPNECQGMSVGEGFTIQMVATQSTGELDSFDNQYDNAADYPYISAPANRPASGATSVKVSTPGDTGVAVNIPATTFNALPQEVTKIALAHTEAKVDVAAKTVTFDSVELVDQSGKIINLGSNTADLTITLPVSGIDNGASVDIFHDGEPMGTTTVTDGKITYTTTHLCKILVAPEGSFVSSAEQLTAALTTGKSAVLLKDIVIPTDNTIIVGSGTTSALNLDGHTISSTNARTATHNDFILVKGTLNISNGTVKYQHTGTNMGWNGATSVFDVTAGGVLNLNAVTVKNLGGTDMNFAVHLNNWGAVTLNADNCVFDAPYCGVRVFNSGYDMNNVTITNSKLTGLTRAFWVHNYLGDLDSTQHPDEAIKARLNLDIYNNNNAFEITGEAESPIRYGFDTTVYFNADGSQLVDTAAELQDAINNGSGDITLTGDIDLSDLINSGN